MTSTRAPERFGPFGLLAALSEALEQWRAMARLRQVITADRNHGAVSDETRRWAKDIWSASA